jgi:ribose transport system substrate-binding protein
MSVRNVVLLICCVPLAVVGCGSGEKAPAAEGSGAPGDGKVVIGLVSPALTSTFHVTFVKGAQGQGTALGWTVESLAPDRETNFAAQVNMVEALVRRKVSAISICAINDKAIIGAIEKANAANIPVFVHNSLTELTGAKVAAYIGYDQRKAGRLCGEYAVKCITERHGEPKGKVYLLLGVPGLHTTERSAGFLEAVQAHPGIEVVAQTPANWERQQAMNVASAALKATPDIDVFFGCSDAMAQGAAQAAREMSKDVFTIGIDGNPDTLQDIKNGVVTGTCAVFPAKMGEITMDTIKKALAGEAVGPMVETPIEIIDKSNVGPLLAQ